MGGNSRRDTPTDERTNAQTPSQSAARKCVNCGLPGQIASDCRKPKKAPGERPCFGCGKTGHVFRDCKEKRVNLSEVPHSAAPSAPAKTTHVMCLQLEGQDSIRRGQRVVPEHVPQPVVPTVGSSAAIGPKVRQGDRKRERKAATTCA